MNDLSYQMSLTKISLAGLVLYFPQESLLQLIRSNEDAVIVIPVQHGTLYSSSPPMQRGTRMYFQTIREAPETAQPATVQPGHLDRKERFVRFNPYFKPMLIHFI